MTLIPSYFDPATYREGYFMNADEQRTQKALLKLDYDETKEREALLRRKIDQIAEGFINLGERLKTRPEEFSINPDPEGAVKDYQELSAALQDLKRAIAEKQGLQRRLNDAGISYTP